MAKEKLNWTKYKTETGLICGYRFKNGEYQIKVFTSLPRMYYYSALAEAGLHFEENIEPNLKENENTEPDKINPIN